MALYLLGTATGGLAGAAILALNRVIQTIELPLFAVFADHQAMFAASGMSFRLGARRRSSGARARRLIVE